MNYGNLAKEVKAYQQTGVVSEVEDASPHRIIQLLFEGAIDKIAIAKGFMQREEFGSAGSHISWAISIIEGLRTSLDHSAPGELSDNLESLYEYMKQRLYDANKNHEVALLDEVSDLLKTIKSGWDEIPEEYR